MKITSFPGQASPRLMGSSRRSVCRDKDQIQSNLQKFQLVEFQNESFEDESCVSCGFWNVFLTILLLEISHFFPDVILHMSASDWWLKSSQILRNQHCYSGVYDRRLAAMWLCFVFASPLLGVWWSLLGPAVISLGKKARSGRRLYNDDQVHHNT